ncbi:unnamed protein product [Mytilus coruscus]|uniref:Uncharacterized protein n=1 Tax=Mytilus coruscus TaxID=42192 RepID=A0A6J8EQP5_MYTCO|nr:unnamed protein product [Mytilus coruscus]
MIMKLNQQLVDCGTVLQNKQLFAKQSIGDRVAQEMKYHPSCLAIVYNREREQRDKQRPNAVLCWLQTSLKLNEKESVVCLFLDLANLDEKIDTTWFFFYTCTLYALDMKEKCLQTMSELEAHTKDRDVLLMFEKDIGPAIEFACNYNGIIHVEKTPEMIRCHLSTKKTTFFGSLVSEDIDDIYLLCYSSRKIIQHGLDNKSYLDYVC